MKISLAMLLAGCLGAGCAHSPDSNPGTAGVGFRAGMTVRDLVVQQPVAKRVLEQLGIDYCCGGQKPLDQALQEKGITASELNGRIALAISKAQARGESVQDWSKASSQDLITHIVDTHHAYLKTELPRLRVLFAKVMRAHGEHHGAMLEPMQKEFLALAAELDTHLQKEETVVFPRIVALDAAARGKQPKPAGAAIDTPLRELLQEHDRAGAILASLNKRSSHYTPPADACPTFIELFASLHRLEEDLHEHVHLENNLLYPQVPSLEAGKP